MKLSNLKNKHQGEDIWVLGSGSSLNFIKKSFFENKITIGINRSVCHFHCDYVVAKDKRGFKEIESNSVNPQIQRIYSKFNCGSMESFRNDEPANKKVIYFEHPQNRKNPAIDYIGKNHISGEEFIIVSLSTITTGIHIAAYMGAKNIMICGHDCGTLNKQISIKGYDANVSHVQDDEEYLSWLNQIENHTIKICKKIQEIYGCNIHSLNPFINFNLEGFKFESSPNITEARYDV